MDNKSKQNGGYSNLSRLLLLLFLTGLPSALSQTTETPEPGLQIEFYGMDYITVGVPTTIECLAPKCPTCTYSMDVNGEQVQGQGNVISFTVKSWVAPFVVSCTATDEDTNVSATATKTLQILVGPANVSITGSNMLDPTVSHTYSCHASCRPSCFYSWKLNQGPWIRGQGNVISITAQEMDSLSTLICKATNKVSGLFVSAVKNINVTTGPVDVQIKGSDVIGMAELSRFVCTSYCLPSCRYVMSADNQTIKGNQVEIEVDVPLEFVTLKCEAQNIISKKIVRVSKTVQVKGPAMFSPYNLSTRPDGTIAVLLLTFIISTILTL